MELRLTLRPPAGAPRVAVLVEQRYLDQAEPAASVVALREAGCDVHVVVAEEQAVALTSPDWLAGVDVVLARGRSAALLGLLRATEATGIPVVNPADAVARVVDKAGMGAALSAAGLPVPRTWLGPVASLAARHDLRFPLVLKPICGDNARGLVVVGCAAELAAVRWPEPVALAQEFHRGNGTDLKLYVAGSTVWALRRPSPIEATGRARPPQDAGRPVPVTPALASLARRCAGLFGLRLLGVDLVDGPGGPLVLEVNDFPNYRGADGSPRAVAELTTALATRTAGAA